MDTIQAARQLVLDAEASLRELISKALAEQRYGDVKEIAELADRVAQILASNNIQLSVSTPPLARERPVPEYHLERQSPEPETKGMDLPAPRKRRVNAKRRSRAKPGYPKFVRDEDRLIKIGWSKKNKEEYAHRVPREAVLAFVRHLGDSVDEGKVFDIDSLFPVKDAAGEEVPGYQVYVIVAWLREVGVIEKKGRDGYFIRDKSVLSGELNELWESLHARTA